MDDMQTPRVIVRGEHIVKRYPLCASEIRRVITLFRKKSVEKNSVAVLRDLSFEMYEGEIIGIVGLNGSGKSTLARIIAGISHPTSGKLTVLGKCDLLSIGSSLNPRLTGRENIRYKCLLLGFSQKEIEAMEDDIIRFAEIGPYIDQPMRTYSSGMRSRLGFAISTKVDPDILIVDEALSVGDPSFASKCMAHINALKASGRMIIFVSHATGNMKGFCDRVMWLHHGRQMGMLPAEQMLPAYEKFIKAYNRLSTEEKALYEPNIGDFLCT